MPIPRNPDGSQIVALRDLTLGIEKFVRSDNGTEQMAVNGSSTQAEDVWDGTGASDTGSDWTRGGTGSEQAAAKRSGTNGLNTGVTSKNDIWWFDYGSDRDLEASFDSVSFWINPQAFPEGSKLRCGFAASGSTDIIGTPAQVTNYVPNMDPGTWQRVTIPLEDFNMDGYAGRFIIQARVTHGQQYYFDDFDMLNSTGDGPYKFRVIGVAGERHHVSRITLAIAAPESGWSSSAFGNITTGLELGLIMRQGTLSTKEVVWSVVMKNNLDMFGQLVPSDPINFSDGEMMLVFNVSPDKSAIVLTDDDGLEFIVRDDLSTLTNMRAYLQYGIEEVV